MGDVVQAVDRETAAQLFQLPVRIDGCWPLAGIGSAPPPEGLRKALEYRRPVELAWLRPFFDADCEPDEHGHVEIYDDDEIWEEFGGECIARGLLGVVLEVHIPVMQGRPSGAVSYSWGHYRMATLYAPTMAEGIAAAMKLANDAWEQASAGERADG